MPRGLVVLFLLCAGFKPVTHIRLAYDAYQDALDDGKVEIFEVDADGKLLQSLGSFDVDPRILQALRNHKEQYFAGIIGPDAYPDIVTGQMRIHPPAMPLAPGQKCQELYGPDTNCFGSGTDAWLTKLWDLAQAGSDAELAFVVGMLGHASGDMFAHTYVNTLTGGIFALKQDNGFKHMVVEGYIGERTDRTAIQALYPMVKEFGISDGVDRFIAQHTIDAAPFHPQEDGKAFSVPWAIHSARRWVRTELDRYFTELARLQAEWQRWEDERRRWDAIAWCSDPVGVALPFAHINCDTVIFPDGTKRHVDPVLHLEARARQFDALFRTIAARLLLDTHRLGEPFMKYARDTVLVNFDRAQLEWVRTSHRVGMALLFDPKDAMDFGEATRELTSFATGFVLRVLGVPDKLVEGLAEVQKLTAELSKVVGKVQTDIVDALIFKPGTGRTLEQHMEILTKPHAFLDEVMGIGGNTPVTRAQIDAELGVVSPTTDDGWLHPTTFNVDPARPEKIFAAGFNAVTMTKLSLLGRPGMDALLARLGSQVRTDDTWKNALLGYLETIDGSNPWVAGTQMILARDCAAWKRVFLPQPSPRRSPPRYWEPQNTCGFSYPRPTLTASAANVTAGQTLTLRASEPLRFTPLSPAWGSLTVAADRRSATYNAPATVPFDAEVSVLGWGEDEHRRLATATFRLWQPILVTTLPDPSAATGADLQPGQHRRFGLVPDVPATWHVVSGTGVFGEEARRRQLEEQIRKHGAEKLRLLQAAGAARDLARRCEAAARPPARPTVVRTMTTTTGVRIAVDLKPPVVPTMVRPAPMPGCQGAEGRMLATRRALAAHAAAHDDAHQAAVRELEGIASTYYAPATLSVAQTVVIEARATDGSARTARATFFLAASPPPLQSYRDQVREIPSGGSFTPRVMPTVPVTWQLVSGPAGGTLGPDTQGLRAIALRKNVVLLKGRPVVLSRGGVAPRTTPELGKALLELNEIESTYRAPVVTRPEVVTLKGTAMDGTGRTVVVTVTIKP
jgi:hypothetical protein